MTAPAGLDLGRLTAHLEAAVPGLVRAPLTAVPLTGGKSNLTYRVTGADGAAVVVRRPPLGHVLPTAHDMGREARMLRTLRPHGVPVPEALHLCEDPSVVGTPFLVMEWIEGRTVDSWAAEGGPAAVDAACRSLVTALADLHRVAEALPSTRERARPGYLRRQVERWTDQIKRSRTGPSPEVDELGRRLAGTRLEDAGATQVHGDYRFDNILLARDEPRVVAILDWEMATVGDPIADLALLLVYWHGAGDGRRSDVPVAIGQTTGDGFWDRRRLVEGYEIASGRQVPDLRPYLGVAAYKLAGVLQGIHARHVHGGTVGEGSDGLERGVTALAELGLWALDEGVDGLAR